MPNDSLDCPKLTARKQISFSTECSRCGTLQLVWWRRNMSGPAPPLLSRISMKTPVTAGASSWMYHSAKAATHTTIKGRNKS